MPTKFLSSASVRLCRIGCRKPGRPASSGLLVFRRSGCTCEAATRDRNIGRGGSAADRQSNPEDVDKHSDYVQTRLLKLLKQSPGPHSRGRSGSPHRRGSPPSLQSLSRTRRLFLRRLTVISFGAALIGEKVTGQGCIASLGAETGVPLSEMEPEVLIVAVLLGVAAFQPDLWPRHSANSLTSLIAKSAEHIVDSALCLAFSLCLLIEGVTGKGILAVLQVPDLGTPLTQPEAAASFLVLLFLTQGSEIFSMEE
mmetsp:Transcript_7575/g.18194  ORF Transcript_7575/g.18194 Transcript_7575/m.18194 type:complete len:254 (-) Transcript_7575:28-789(-)